MSSIDQAGKGNQGEIRYLTPLDICLLYTSDAADEG